MMGNLSGRDYARFFVLFFFFIASLLGFFLIVEGLGAL